MPVSGESERTLAAALRQSRLLYATARPRSRALYEATTQINAGVPAHGFYEPFPLTIADSIGANVQDLDGQMYTDFAGDSMARLSSHPAVRDAIKNTSAKGKVAGELSERRLEHLLQTRFPSCEAVRFCRSGTEANLLALSGARRITGRPRAMVFKGAYHGAGLYFPQATTRIGFARSVVVAEFNNPERTKRQIRRSAGSIAAIIVEPLMGIGGGIPANVQFLQILRDEATRHGIILIFDEVMTCLLSPGGLQQTFSVRPDMTTFGRHLSGGMPFGAIGARKDIFAALNSSEAVNPYCTESNDFGVIIAETALRKLFTPQAIETLNLKGDLFRSRLNHIACSRSVPVQFTGIGAVMFAHFTRRRICRPLVNDVRSDTARALFHIEMLSRGQLVSPAGFVCLSLFLSEDDLDTFAEAFEELLQGLSPILQW